MTTINLDALDVPKPGALSLGDLWPGGLRTIVGNSNLAVTVVTTLLPHGLSSLDSVVFASSNSNGSINGLRVITYVSPTTFTIPVDCQASAGTAGTWAVSLTAAISNPGVVTTGRDHLLRTGDTVTIAGSDSTPSLNGLHTVTVTGARTFTVPVNVTAVATVGNYTKTTYYSDVLDRGESLFPAALVLTSTIGTAPTTATVNIQGSADGVNWWNVPYALVATPASFDVTALTITPATATTYLLKSLVPWRYLRLACSAVTNVRIVATIQAYR